MRSHLSKKAGTNEINSNFIEIRGNLVRLHKIIIQMSNISMMKITNFPKVPFPLWSILIGLAGICCLLFGMLSDNLPCIITGVLSGILITEVPVFAIWFWKRKKKRLEHMRKLNFIMNCGITQTMIFSDLDFLGEVVKVFTNILAESDTSQNIYFDITKSDMIIKNNNYDIHDIDVNDNSSVISMKEGDTDDK